MEYVALHIEKINVYAINKLKLKFILKLKLNKN